MVAGPCGGKKGGIIGKGGQGHPNWEGYKIVESMVTRDGAPPVKKRKPPVDRSADDLGVEACAHVDDPVEPDDQEDDLGAKVSIQPESEQTVPEVYSYQDEDTHGKDQLIDGRAAINTADPGVVLVLPGLRQRTDG